VTDMRLPIQYACSYPERWDAPLPPLDLVHAGRLEFQAPDIERFPCLGLAFRALRDGGTVPVVLNAANEVAVASFLAGEISFPEIARVVHEALISAEYDAPRTISDVLEIDRVTRDRARAMMTTSCS